MIQPQLDMYKHDAITIVLGILYMLLFMKDIAAKRNKDLFVYVWRTQNRVTYDVAILYVERHLIGLFWAVDNVNFIYY